MSDDSYPIIEVDAGTGRWFVIERHDTEFRLIAGPYLTEAAVDRWLDKYTPPAEVESVAKVRCDGKWQDAVTHLKKAIAKIRRQHGR